MRVIFCCARTAMFAVNGRNTVFFYTLFPYFWAIISQSSPGSRRSSSCGTSCPGIPSITLAIPSASNAILAKSL
jgi:hypothetical protein